LQPLSTSHFYGALISTTVLSRRSHGAHRLCAARQHVASSVYSMRGVGEGHSVPLGEGVHAEASRTKIGFSAQDYETRILARARG
jgi:hypothetical protein